MDYVKYMLVLVVMFVDSDAGGHEESHDHVKVHVPEFFHHDHHTKVITIHHHHHKPKKEHHHHHHHHKPIIPYGPPKFYHTHHHAKSSSHIVSKGHTSVGKNHGNHEHHGKQGHHEKHGHFGHHSHSGHDGHHSYKHHDAPSYDPASINYDPPMVNYAPPSVNYSPSASYGSDHSSFLPSVPNIPSPQIHGVVHTVQQVKVFDSLPGALKTGSTGYEVTEHGDEGEEDVFSSVNSLSESYPGTFGDLRNAAEQSDPYSDTDITHSNSHQSPNTDPFSNAQPQTSYANLEDFKIQSQSAQSIPNVQPSYSGVTGFSNAQPQNSYANLDDFTMQSQAAHSIPNFQPSYSGVTGFSNVQPQTSYANHEDFTIQSQSTQSIPNVQPSYFGVTGFSNIEPQPTYANREDFIIQSQSAQSIPNVQPSYSGVTGFDNNDNSVLANDLSGASILSFAEADQDDTPVSFSREAGLQRAINTGGIETVAY
ncbi:protein dissatisfaction-like [Maniola jurtina]|uniref:protein dissatisfaction-like n=1 Tax=Maniola jurtina TaxID=191418 RepID=UPI001E68AB38|nr:protein dissatisfaction-like [Maniola jurtina]